MTELQAAYSTAIISRDQARPLDQNPAAVYLATLSPGTSRDTMRRALDTAAALLAAGGDLDALAFPWQRLQFQHLAALKSELGERYAFATANKILSAVRGVAGAAFDLGQMPAEDYARIKRVKGLRGSRLPAGRAIAAGELAALLGACGDNDTGTRDAAMIAVLYAGGLRRAELVGLDLADYDPAAGALDVRGKGNKERRAYVPAAGHHLADWLRVRGNEPGPLFVGLGNRNRGERLTPQTVYDIVKRRAAAAGVADMSPHDMRRSFVSDLLDAGADLAAVQQLAGHERVTTTARYDRRPERAKQQAAKLLHVPYKGK